MTRPGWNPSRRNRNIGTAKSGHGQNNRLVIPARWSDDRVFWEKLRDPIAIERSVGGRDVIVLVEPVIKGFTHCCTPADVLAMLELLAAEDLGDLRLFVLRQPKRKEATLSSVWGRLAYFAQLGSLSGPAVYLEAQKLGRVLHRRRSMSLDAQREFDRLIADGHHAERVPSGYRIQLTLDACRNTSSTERCCTRSVTRWTTSHRLIGHATPCRADTTMNGMPSATVTGRSRRQRRKRSRTGTPMNLPPACAAPEPSPSTEQPTSTGYKIKASTRHGSSTSLTETSAHSDNS